MKPQKTDAFIQATGPQNKALDYGALESFDEDELDQVREQLNRDIVAMLGQISDYDEDEAPEDWLDSVCIALGHKINDHAFVLSRIQQQRGHKQAYGASEYMENYIEAVREVCDPETLRRIRETAHGDTLAAETAEPSRPPAGDPYEWDDEQPNPQESTAFTHKMK